MIARLRGEQTPEALEAAGAQIGYGVFIGRMTYIDASFAWLISIGDHATISTGVEIIAHDASTKPLLGYTIVAPVSIGGRVYVGASSIILPGVTIGDNAIVGAGSVVRHDVPSGTVAVGSPASVVGTTEDYIARHRAQLETRPRYSKDEWTTTGGISPENRRRMREQLENGVGYVE
jgi:maltose O-acetyltransferase